MTFSLIPLKTSTSFSESLNDNFYDKKKLFKLNISKTLFRDHKYANFSKQLVKIYRYPTTFCGFLENFFKSLIFQNENFELFSTNLENYLMTFFCRFRYMEVTFGLISPKIPTIISELPDQLCQILRFSKKLTFKWNISKSSL